MYCIHQAGIDSGNTQAAGFEQVTLITVDDYMQQTSLPVVIGAAVGAVLGAAILLVILIVIIM